MKTPGIVIGLIAVVAAGFLLYVFFPSNLVQAPTSTEPTGNAAEKADKIRVTTPVSNAVISSPITIVGVARGPWYFEASFPIEVRDGSGTVLGTGIAQAQGDWMTEDFVPFTATINFTTVPSNSTGMLVLKKDNPSGLPEHDDQLDIPIRFGATTGTETTLTIPLLETITAFGVSLTPTKILEDSRCPIDVQCIQAGTVRVEATLAENGVEKVVTLTLGELFATQNGSVTLVVVTPDPHSQVTLSPLDYRLTFKIIKTP